MVGCVLFDSLDNFYRLKLVLMLLLVLLLLLLVIVSVIVVLVLLLLLLLLVLKLLKLLHVLHLLVLLLKPMLKLKLRTGVCKEKKMHMLKNKIKQCKLDLNCKVV